MYCNKALELFLNYKYSCGFTEKTIKHYKSHITYFINYINNKDISDLTYLDYETYIIYLRNKNPKLASRTIKTYATVVKTFIHYLEINNFINTNIYSKIIIPKFQKKKLSILSDNQINILLDAENINTFIGTRNLLIFSLMLGSGLRLSEVVNIK